MPTSVVALKLLKKPHAASSQRVLVRFVCLETAPKTKNSDHAFSHWRTVQGKADDTEHVRFIELH